ncbi:MAG: TolC family outer membrane protein, partial [Proteobacteria bacterium]|nr:TolC family outer membrane protein [Pseudomonadota bacterium]
MRFLRLSPQAGHGRRLRRPRTSTLYLPYVIENHDRLKAAKAKLTTARNKAREALGGWFPTIDQTANFGHEAQNNDASRDTRIGFSEYDISLKQLLWDFGSTNAGVEKARLQVEEAQFTLRSTRQSLILESITAYMNLIRQHKVLAFARESESNIRKQTGLEEAQVEIGSGFKSDVLRAKTQLARAEARRSQNEGALTNALNRYQAVFGRVPDNIDALTIVPYPAEFLPQDVVEAVDMALETNPALKSAHLNNDLAAQDVRATKASKFFPKLEGKAERKFKRNVGGTLGAEQELLAKVEMTFSFNAGFTAVNTLRASESDLSASQFTAADTRRNIEEQVRNAWQSMQTAQRTAGHLNDTANINTAYLEVAREERALGNRTVLDILSAETDLINARSDALSAETDVIVSAYGLLSAMGTLEYELVKVSRGTAPPKFRTNRSKPANTAAPAAQPAQPAPKGQSVPPVTPVPVEPPPAVKNPAAAPPAPAAALKRQVSLKQTPVDEAEEPSTLPERS